MLAGRVSRVVGREGVDAGAGEAVNFLERVDLVLGAGHGLGGPKVQAGGVQRSRIRASSVSAGSLTAGTTCSVATRAMAIHDFLDALE